jgi:putative peptidoglycan lipid II flippase
LWGAALLAQPTLAQLSTLRDETALALLIGVGAVVYGATIFALFGLRGVKALIRG